MDTNAIIAMYTIIGVMVIAICSTLYDVFCNIQEIKPIHTALIAFSLYTNGMKLFKCSNNSDQLGCLHGIKAISMMWVILGHTYINLMIFFPLDNVEYINEWLDDPESMFIITAPIAVDTFFTVGGLLTVFVFMKSKEEEMKESFKKIPLLYLHRYIRLTPALSIIVLIHGSGLIKYITDGPNIESLNLFAEQCAKYWWAALLYIQNYRKLEDLCIIQSWYLSTDFQLFIMSPFLLIPLRKWPKYVLMAMSGLVVIGILVPFYIGYSNKLTGVGLEMLGPAFRDYYYFYTHTRFSPYVIGMIFGYLIHKIKKEGRSSTFNLGTLLLLWILLIGGLLACIFDGMKFVRGGDNRWLDGLYLGFNRSAWSLILSSIILLCCTGNGGPINTLLSHPVFQIMSKLSYSMYLIHYVIIQIVMASSRTVAHFTNFVAIFQFFSFFIITLSISVLFSLLFESPILVIEKMIFQRPSDEKVKITEESKENV